MDCPIPGARGTLRPEGRCTNGVMILGEAMGEQELEDGLPFRPFAQAGSVVERAITRIGTQRDMYVVWNVLPTHPPANFINPKWEAAAIEWGREALEEQIERFHPKVILALGNTALRATTGLSGEKLGVSHLSGYLLPPIKSGYPPVIPCFHPAYLRRGNMSLLGVLMRALRLAIQVAKEQRQPILPPVDNPPAGYITHPTEAIANEFLRQARDINPEEGYCAYDIETFYSNSEESAEEGIILGAADLRSIQFSIAPGSGIYLPWREPFREIAKAVLAVPCRKLSWNGWRFDDPLIRANDCTINGTLLDLMWAWHHMQPDIPRGLQFAGAHQGPRIHNPTASWPWPWKHLDHQSHQFYGIVDVDILQWMVSYD